MVKATRNWISDLPEREFVQLRSKIQFLFEVRSKQGLEGLGQKPSARFLKILVETLKDREKLRHLGYK